MSELENWWEGFCCVRGRDIQLAHSGKFKTGGSDGIVTHIWGSANSTPNFFMLKKLEMSARLMGF